MLCFKLSLTYSVLASRKIMTADTLVIKETVYNNNLR